MGKTKVEGSTVFKKFIEKKEKPGQIYARVEIDKFNKFKELCDAENISMAQGVSIALDLMFDFYQKELNKKSR